MVGRGCNPQRNVLLAASIAEQRLAAHRGIKESGYVARKGFVTDCVVRTVRRISQRLKSYCRTLAVFSYRAEGLEAHGGVGAACSVTAEGGRTNRGVRPNFGVPAPARRATSGVVRESTIPYGGVRASGVAIESRSTDRRVSITAVEHKRI